MCSDIQGQLDEQSVDDLNEDDTALLESVMNEYEGTTQVDFRSRGGLSGRGLPLRK